jgi:hypothetical protein
MLSPLTIKVRALTRNPSKPSAKALLEYGPNIVLQQCDLNSKSSLNEALKGVYGFYCLTDYFAHKIEKPEDVTEEAEGKSMAETAKSAGVTHFIYSTLPEVKERSGGKYKNVHHFDGKHRVEQYARTLGFEIDSYVAPSCYMQNFTGPVSRVVCSHSLMGLINQDEDGTVVFALPLPSLDSTIPICDVGHDLGVAVKAIFDLGSKAKGKIFPLVGEFIQVHLYLQKRLINRSEILLRTLRTVDKIFHCHC